MSTCRVYAMREPRGSLSARAEHGGTVRCGLIRVGCLGDPGLAYQAIP
jgi:hypothetical protein